MMVPATPTVDSSTAELTAARALPHTWNQLIATRSCCCSAIAFHYASSGDGWSRPAWAARAGDRRTRGTAWERLLLLVDPHPVDLHVGRDLGLVEVGQLPVRGQQAEHQELRLPGDVLGLPEGLAAVDTEDVGVGRPLDREHVVLLPPRVAVLERVGRGGLHPTGLGGVAVLVAVVAERGHPAVGVCRPEVLDRVDLTARLLRVAGDRAERRRLHPERAVHAARLLELHPGGGHAVGERVALLGADVAVEVVAGARRVFQHAELEGAV